MIKSDDINRSSVITGILLNLLMSMIFIVFITLGYKSTTENAAIQDDTFRTHFQSRLILKSINGINHSRADLLMALKINDDQFVRTAEDSFLGAKSNYQLLQSEQTINKSRLSGNFNGHFNELVGLYNQAFKNDRPLADKKLLELIFDKATWLTGKMHEEESSLWIDEALKLHKFSKVKERNLHVFYALTVCFVLIQLVFIYFTIIKHRMNKKIIFQHERLVLQTRLSTLGMMSAELAHEINSPLMVIDGRLRILHNELLASEVKNEKLLKNIEIIKRNSLRIQGIIRSFKTMSKSGEKDLLESFQLSAIFDEMNDIVLQKLQDEQIHFTIDNFSSEIKIVARRIQIVQVLTNLINNSMDAIKGSAHPWIKVCSKVERNKILIYVTDSGSGILPEHVDLIFDPFYSTKGSEVGTGLGLSISKKIMKEHGGDLIYNASSLNTEFILIFKNEMNS